MSSNFKMYQDATNRLGSGWMHGDWNGPQGEVCLVQSVLEALGGSTNLRRRLPDDVVEDLSRTLMHYKEYRAFVRLFRFIAENRPGVYSGICDRQKMDRSVKPEQLAMIAWNDTAWRLKHQVVRVMKATAYDTELVWQRARVAELESELGSLKSQKAVLEARITELEASNRSLLMRLGNKVMTVRAERELQEIDTQLDRIHAEHLQLTGDAR